MSSEKKEYQWDTVLLGLVSNRKNEGGKHTTKSTHSSLGGFFFFFFPPLWYDDIFRSYSCLMFSQSNE